MSNDVILPDDPNAYPGSFAVRLFHARGAHPPIGLTQAQLAERAGLQQSTIAHYEAGRREPNLSNLRRLVRATGQSADYLIATRPGTDDDYQQSGAAVERPAERRYRVSLTPPEQASAEVRARAGDVEIVGRLYVLRCPEHSSESERERAGDLLEETLKSVHGDGSPYSWLVLPDGWSIEAGEVEPA
jgi:transcriptional regulator with XRE-family HTH domain